jgi:hypothetical protein
VIHPGRPWAVRCKGTPRKRTAIAADIKSHLDNLSVKP